MKNSKELDLEHAKTEKLINDITYPLFIKIDKQKDEIERLNNIIEKAVEYIKENAKYKKVSINNRKYYNEYLINQVLDILNSRSDE